MTTISGRLWRRPHLVGQTINTGERGVRIYLVVVWIVSRRDLDGASSELDIDHLISDDFHQTSVASELEVFFAVRVDTPVGEGVSQEFAV